ncbi:MAG: hypothetical protein RL272_1186, partial [Candidatus Parcubacteria bacterium]
MLKRSIHMLGLSIAVVVTAALLAAFLYLALLPGDA